MAENKTLQKQKLKKQKSDSLSKAEKEAMLERISDSIEEGFGSSALSYEAEHEPDAKKKNKKKK